MLHEVLQPHRTAPLRLEVEVEASQTSEDICLLIPGFYFFESTGDALLLSDLNVGWDQD